MGERSPDRFRRNARGEKGSVPGSTAVAYTRGSGGLAYRIFFEGAFRSLTLVTARCPHIHKVHANADTCAATYLN